MLRTYRRMGSSSQGSHRPEEQRDKRMKTMEEMYLHTAEEKTRGYLERKRWGRRALLDGESGKNYLVANITLTTEKALESGQAK